MNQDKSPSVLETKHEVSKSSFFEGCIDSLPVCFSFVFLFFAIGSLLNEAGYSIFQALIMTLAVHAAPLQVFLAQNGGNITIAAVIITTLIINFRFLIMSSVLSSHFKDVSLWKVLGATQLLSISTFTLSHSKADKVNNLFFYYLGCGISTLSVATLFTGIGFFVRSNDNYFTTMLVPMILPIHFTVMAAMMWPKIKSVAATIIGFLITPFIGAIADDYQIFFVPFIVAGSFLIFSVIGDKK